MSSVMESVVSSMGGKSTTVDLWKSTMGDDWRSTMIDMGTLGERMLEARKERGLTQSALADAAGVTKQAISAIENGGTKSPEATTIDPIARELGVRTSWLLTGRGPRQGSDGGESQQSGLDRDRLDQTVKFLDQLFAAHGREFSLVEHSMLIAQVYDDLSKASPMNLVALSRKYGQVLSGSEDDERQRTTGSAGADDREGAGKRTTKAQTPPRRSPRKRAT